MTGRSLQAAWRDQLERAPECTALTFVDAAGHACEHSRASLNLVASARARALAELGLAPGDVCVLALPSDETCATLVLGVLLAGGVPLLVAPPAMRSSHDNIHAILAHTAQTARARVVIVQAELLEDAVAALGEDRFDRAVITPADVDGSGDGSGDGAGIGVMPAMDSIAAMQLTSGTTGFPRICVWTHERMLAAIDGMAMAMPLADDDRVCNWVPLYHDMGLVNNFLVCLTRGVPLVMLTPTSFIRKPALWLRTLSDFAITQSWSPNFGFAVAAARIRDDELDDVRLDHVRALWNAAERIHLETMRAFHGRFAPLGLRWSSMKTNYGCAENVGGATFSAPDEPPVVDWVDRGELLSPGGRARIVEAESEGATSIVSVGRPTPGLHLEIVAPDGAPAPDGQIGEITLHSPSRMVGYLQPDGSVTHAQGPVVTGDLGYTRGAEIYWTGRLRETIVIRGRKLDPSDFERVLLGADGVRPGCFTVFGVDDSSRGTQRLIIATELDPAAPDESHVAEAIRSRVELELGLQVDEVLLVDKGTLTKTTSGKRRHLHFRDLYLRGELHHRGS